MSFNWTSFFIGMGATAAIEIVAIAVFVIGYRAGHKHGEKDKPKG